jgi:hypothetical protein
VSSSARNTAATSGNSLAIESRARAPISDTGALLDYLVRTASDHARFRVAIDAARARFVPGLVLAEVDDSLRDQREAMRLHGGSHEGGVYLCPDHSRSAPSRDED